MCRSGLFNAGLCAVSLPSPFNPQALNECRQRPFSNDFQVDLKVRIINAWKCDKQLCISNECKHFFGNPFFFLSTQKPCLCWVYKPKAAHSQQEAVNLSAEAEPLFSIFHCYFGVSLVSLQYYSWCVLLQLTVTQLCSKFNSTLFCRQLIKGKKVWDWGGGEI